VALLFGLSFRTVLLPAKRGGRIKSPVSLKYRLNALAVTLLLAVGSFLTSAGAYGQIVSEQSGGSETRIGVKTIASATALRMSKPGGQAIPTTRFTPAARPSFREYFDQYVDNTYGPGSLLGPAVGAAMTQWTTHNPREWGQGFDGYGRRVASGYGRKVISNTVALPIAYLMHEDPRYYPSKRKGIWPRARYALIHTFVTRNTKGGEMPFFSSIAGSYAAAFAANAWYPASSADAAHVFYRGSTAMASGIAYNELREFWPDLKKLLFHR